MMRSLFSGVSGLKNHQTSMDVIGNNIANVNTVGYKSSRVVFQDIFSQTISNASAPATDGSVGGVNAKQIGLGVTTAAIVTDTTEGSTATTDNPLDFQINGEGYFTILGNDGSLYYTRNGCFTVDSQGYLVTTSGNYVLGIANDYSIDSEGVINVTSDNVSKVTNGELEMGVSVGWPVESNIDGETVYLNRLQVQGNVTEPLSVTGNVVNGTNAVYTYDPDTGEQTGVTDATAATITLDFAGTEFELQGEIVINGTTYYYDVNNLVDEEATPPTYPTVADVLADLSLSAAEATAYTDGAAGDGALFEAVPATEDDTSAFIIDTVTDEKGNALVGGWLRDGDKLIWTRGEWGGDTEYTVGAKDEDGDLTAAAGVTEIAKNAVFASYNGADGDTYTDDYIIDQNGVVSAINNADNTSVNLGRLVLTTFNNPAGLEKIGGSLFQVSNNSGDAKMNLAGSESGTLSSGGYEMSNVNIASELTNMIITQRGFQANSRVITVSDTMLEELVNLKR